METILNIVYRCKNCEHCTVIKHEDEYNWDEFLCDVGQPLREHCDVVEGNKSTTTP